MIPIRNQLLLLKRNARIVIVVENRLPRFQHWHALSMNRRGVEQECSSGRTLHFKNLCVSYFIIFHQAWMLPPMASLDEIERAAAHVGQIHGQLNFFVNFPGVSLIVPGVAVPTMKVTPRR